MSFDSKRIIFLILAIAMVSLFAQPIIDVHAVPTEVLIPAIHPQSIAFDSAGNLYVADSSLGTVLQYDSTGNLLDAEFASGLDFPTSLAFDSAGNLYVANGRFGTVLQYDSTGNLLDAEFASGLDFPTSIAFDSNDYAYIVDNRGIFTTNLFSNPGDLNRDNDVDADDRNLLRAALGACIGDVNFNLDADFDEDGCITYNDYRIWYGHYIAFVNAQNK